MAMLSVGLVACAKTKSHERQAAQDMYLSHLFMLARLYCQKTYLHWYILSAAHGLLDPKMIIDPYDVTLAAFTPAARQKWAEKVIRQAKGQFSEDQRVMFTFHAGGWYARLLAGRIGDSRLPLKGLPIGRQINWYLERL